MVSIVTQPSHGTLSNYLLDQVTSSVISVTYKADNGYTGPDSFTWKVKEFDTTELYVCDPVGTVNLTVE